MTKKSLASRRSRNGEELIGIIGATVAESLARFGIGTHLADPVSAEIATNMRANLGGDYVYIPKGRPDADEKAAEAHALFLEGHNVGGIAAKFNCTVAYVYILIARERRRLKDLRRSLEPLKPRQVRDENAGGQS